MTAREYDNFDLHVEAAQDGSFRARVVSSPSGEVAEETFTLPFGPTRLENLLLRLDPGRSDVRRGPADPRVEAGRELGQGLFQAVFSGDVALAWARCRDTAHAQGRGLRLRLRLDDAPTIAGLPWELLYDRRTNTYLAQSERTPVVRFLDVPQTLRPLHVGGALHVLTVISAPTDLPDLDVEAEWARVQEALRDRVEAGTVVLDRLPEATLAALGTWLRRHTAHVLHFVGHGDHDPVREDGVLYFCDRFGRGVPVTASVLGPYVYDHDPLRLIVLNACRTASVTADDPFAGMAQGLVQQHSAAVVAMQFPITDRAALTFTGEFYGAVADEYPVDQAVTYARKALSASFGSEWATPTVFMQAADGMVFDQIVPETPLAPDSPRASEPTPGPAPVPTPVPTEGPVPDPADEGGRRTGRTLPLLPLAGGVLALVAGAALWWALTGTGDEGTDDDPAAGPASSAAPGTATPSPSASPGGVVPTLPFQPQAAVSVSSLPAPITVDGQRSDWPDGWNTYDSEHVTNDPVQELSVNAEWRLAWDPDHLLLFVEVTDATLTQTWRDRPDRLWNGDGIGLTIGPRLQQVSTVALDPADRQVLIGPTEQGEVVGAVRMPEGGAFRSELPFEPLLADMEAERTPTGYAIEAAVPWGMLGLEEVAEFDVFAFNLQVSDALAAGPDRGQLNTLQSNNPEFTDDVTSRHLWGTLELWP